MLKIGELARKSGLTVRALHHYDSLGLLCPSARSDAGYRLYDARDLARLKQIQALRAFGMPLADIGAFLANPDARLMDIVERQITVLTRTIKEAAATRSQLEQLRDGMRHGHAPDLASWLTTLESMSMMDKYFSKEEMERLPFAADKERVMARWQDMAGRARQLIEQGVAPSDAAAMRLGLEWMAALERDSGDNPSFALRVTEMSEREPSIRAESGVTKEIEQYVRGAYTEARLAIFRKYLDDDEYAFMRAHINDRGLEWPGLIAQVRAQFDGGAAPEDAQVQALMRRWIDLSNSYIGTNPATHAKVRSAIEREPDLMIGSWIPDAMRPWIGRAMMAARQGG